MLKSHPIFRNHPDIKKLPDPPSETGDYTTRGRIAEIGALSSYVYKDGANRTWFQMDAGGTIYHFKDPLWETGSAALQSFSGQHMTPVFKLISPDGSGGSGETVVDNPIVEIVHALGHQIPTRRFSLGNVGQTILVSNRLNTNSWFQGSYNYSETVDVGNSEHDKRDVQTHKNWKRKDIYVNPDNRFLPLEARRFPVKAPGEQVPLAQQKRLADVH